MNDIINLISELGYPAAICIMCIFAVKYIYDDNRRIISDYNKSYSDFSEALNKNTLILEKLIDKIEENKNE